MNAEVYDLVLGDEHEEEWSPVKAEQCGAVADGAGFSVGGGVLFDILLIQESSNGRTH